MLKKKIKVTYTPDAVTPAVAGILLGASYPYKESYLELMKN